MASAEKNLSDYSRKEDLDAEGIKFGIAVSEWNDAITGAMLNACIKTLKKHKAEEDKIHVVTVPGTFELPSASKMLIQQEAVDVVISLGCVIKGETQHDEYINQSVANGLTQLALISNVPCIFGVLTTNDLQQAKDRSGGKHGNKGIEAAVTAIRMAKLKKDITGRSKSIGF